MGHRELLCICLFECTCTSPVQVHDDGGGGDDDDDAADDGC